MPRRLTAAARDWKRCTIASISKPSAIRRGYPSVLPPGIAQRLVGSAADNQGREKVGKMAEQPGSKGIIVVGIDGSEESKAALVWAERQAKLTGATLQMVTTWQFPTLYGEGMIGVEGLDFA